MNNLTINEKKSLYVLMGILGLCILEYTVFDLNIISSKIESFLTLLIFGLISIYIFTQPRAHQKTRDRLVGYYFVWLFVCGIIYLVIYFSCGFLFEFGRNPYKRDAIGILENVLMFGGIIVLKEWIRNFVINKADKKHMLFYGAAIVFLYTAIEVNLLDILSAGTVEEFTIEFSEKIMPAIAINIFLTYVCYIGGYLPAMMYMLVTNIPIWFFDNLPNLEWIVIAVLGIAFPMIALIALMETVNNTAHKRTRRIKTEPTTKNVFLWIFVGAFCIVISFFTAGLFNTFPTVLVSGSMSPTINRGDVVVIKKVESDDEIYIDDVIIFNAGEFDVVHRVVDIYYENGVKKYITKGDNNKLTDNLDIEIKNIGGVVIAKIPYIGLPRLMLDSAEHESEINIG